MHFRCLAIQFPLLHIKHSHKQWFSFVLASFIHSVKIRAAPIEELPAVNSFFSQDLFIVTLIVGVRNCSMFCCILFYVNSSIEIILMGKRELVALLNLSSWCLVMVERLFLAVPQGCLRFVIVVFPDHTRLLFLSIQQLIVMPIQHML